ncbi:MAG: DUF5130 family protein [Frankiales bacterium]|nr:DUF5130 family protein [Frankiales bacterium]
MPPGEALSAAQRARLQQSIVATEAATGLRIRLHLGPLADGRAGAEALLVAEGTAAADTVVVAVDPGARALEIVTGTRAASQLSDRSCGLAALAMTSSFTAGDLVGGLVNGLQVIADHGRRQRVLHLDRA